MRYFHKIFPWSSENRTVHGYSGQKRELDDKLGPVSLCWSFKKVLFPPQTFECPNCVRLYT